MLWPEKRVAVLPKGLQRAKSPAESLANEHARRVGSFSPGDGFLVIADAPAQAADGDGEIRVLSNGVRGDSPCGVNGALAPSAQRAGNDGDAVQQIESALLHVLAGDVFESLPASEPARAITDFNVASDGANFRIGEVPEKFAKGVGLDFGVGVDGDDNFGVGFRESAAQSGRFATIRLVNDADARIAGEVFIEEFAGFVSRAIVDNDDVKVFDVRGEHRRNRLHDDIFFVVSGDEHGHPGLRDRHHGAVGTEFFDHRQDADNQGASADEHDAEDKDGSHSEAEPLINSENESIGASFEAFLRGERKHQLGASFAQKIGHRDKLVAASAQ